MTPKRNLEVENKLLAELQLTRAQLGLSGPPRLLESDLERVRAELDVSLSDDLLAVFAMLERDPLQMLVLTEELREEGLPATLVALFPDTAKFTWCLRKSKGTLCAWPARPKVSTDLVEVVARIRAAAAEQDDVELDDDEEIDAPLELDVDPPEASDEGDEGGDDSDEGASERRADRESAADLARQTAPRRRMKRARKRPARRSPRAVEDVVPWVEPAVRQDRWVAHPRFGRGRVLREVRDGRHFLEIEFEDGSSRKLLAEFVRDA